MRAFQAIAVTMMGAFFVWLLLQMSRTPETDQRLLMLTFAFGAAAIAIVAGTLLGGRDRRNR